MTTTMNKRIAELSATLKPIERPYTEQAYDEMWGSANDFISYNSPYYCNGLQKVDFDGFEYSCVIQSIEEFQVIRFFCVNVYMSGDQMFNYYSNEFQHQEDPNWMDDDFYEPDELEVKGVSEVKQIWIDRQGNVTTNILDMEFLNRNENYLDDVGCFVDIHRLQPWAYEPRAKASILASIVEYDDYCYTTNEKPSLEFMLSQTAEFLCKNEEEFYNLICYYGMWKEAEPFFRTYKVAHRHHFAFPNEYEDIKKWLDYLDMIKSLDEHLLTQPQYILSYDNAIYTRYEQAENERRRAEDERRQEEERLRREEEAERMLMEQTSFAEQHSWLFGIEFDSDNFHFKSLDSIEAYKTEGEIMHHCIYACNYYKKPYYLAMHITDHEGNRVATCTVDLQRDKIDQIQPMCDDIGFFKTYGIEWQTTNDYKEIWNILCARMHTFPHKREEQKEQKQQLKIAV